MSDHTLYAELLRSDMPKTPYMDALRDSLPPTLWAAVAEQCAATPMVQKMMETMLAFATGGDGPLDLPASGRQEWIISQMKAMEAFEELATPRAEGKRKRGGEEPSGSSAKKQRITAPMSASDEPLFTLHALSVNSPVRKKVDITIHRNTLRFSNPTTREVEATIALSTLKRTFIVPTRGKAKPHWTVMLLASDLPDRGKNAAAAPPQVIFGLDTTTTGSFSTTKFINGTPNLTSHPKGTSTLPLIHTLLSSLPSTALPILEPSTSQFRSASAPSVPGIEAYRSAKSGSLWFFPQGILWGESKPCEFFPLSDILGAVGGIRVISATGRTCSIYIRRKDPQELLDDDDDGEPEGLETEFGGVDGKEQEPVGQWVRKYRHHFGKEKAKKEAASTGTGATANGGDVVPQAVMEDESDPEDEDFDISSEDDDGGSATSDSSDGDENHASGEEDVDGDAEGSEAESEEEDRDEGEGEELDPRHHLLLRPGAMPSRVSKAVLNSVVGMVEEDMIGRFTGTNGVSDEDQLSE